MPNKITTFRHFIKNAPGGRINIVIIQQISFYLTIIENVKLSRTCRELRRIMKKLPLFQTLKEIQTPSDHCFRLTEILNENWITRYHNIDNLIFCIRCLILMLVLSSCNKSLCILSVMTYVSYTLFWTDECLQGACRG